MYLGAIISENMDVKHIINQRIVECVKTWRALADYWNHGNTTINLKIIIYSAIIKAKLMCGLTTLHLTQNAFQLKGLRQIKNIDNIYNQI